MRRNFLGLVSLLVGLTIPIVWEYFRHGQPFPNAFGWLLMIFGLGLSAPLLVVYSLLVYVYTELPQKRWLSGIALLIGLGWILFMIYSLSTAVD
ncbi:hypothetical protein GCM10028805_25250 [Spirosoma harenae]